MPRDGSGNASLPSGNPVTTGTAISSTVHNATMTDVASMLTASLAKDGQTVPTANLPMGTFRHTNVGDASARNHYSATGQVQDNAFNTVASVSGTNSVTGSLSPAITSYSPGMMVVFTPANTNTGATTAAWNGLTALDVLKAGGIALVAGDLVAGVPAFMILDSGADDWYLLNPQVLTVTESMIADGSVLARVAGTETISGAWTFSVNPSGITLSTSGITSGTFVDARIAQSNVTQHQAALSITTSQLTGNMPDARIIASNVTQHQASLTLSSLGGSLNETQIADGSVLARVAGTETISGAWTYSTRPKFTSAGGFLSHASSSNTGGSIEFTNVIPGAVFGNPGDIRFIYE